MIPLKIMKIEMTVDAVEGQVRTVTRKEKRFQENVTDLPEKNIIKRQKAITGRKMIEITALRERNLHHNREELKIVSYTHLTLPTNREV